MLTTSNENESGASVGDTGGQRKDGGRSRAVGDGLVDADVERRRRGRSDRAGSPCRLLSALLESSWMHKSDVHVCNFASVLARVGTAEGQLAVGGRQLGGGLERDTDKLGLDQTEREGVVENSGDIAPAGRRAFSQVDRAKAIQALVRERTTSQGRSARTQGCRRRRRSRSQTQIHR